MSVVWLAPIAFAGIALVLAPLAIHLFVRQHTRRVPFPSLRFLRDTQLAAFRVRRIEDARLLLVRAAIIVAAALALAGPVLQNASRRAANAARISRATIAMDAAATRNPAPDLFRSASFHRAEVVDAIADAMRWLDQQPSSSREIVFTGAIRRGEISDADLAGIPPDIGVRFEQQSAASSSDVTVPILTLREGALVRIDRAVHLSADATTVSDGPATAVSGSLVRITGSDQSLADAALRAALSAGVPWRDFETPVTVKLPDHTAIGDAADVVLRQLRLLSPPVTREPVPITSAQLARWTRLPGAPSVSAPIADEGDRRWLWVLTLLLLAIEWRMRRHATVSEISQEIRVA